ncbi:MAG: hypothetical protein GF355_09500 [Candidatus Eisenbacteria bacterium]|nr:hypothetical protein [Candidatus Eisenbacteria bacterium]
MTSRRRPPPGDEERRETYDVRQYDGSVRTYPTKEVFSDGGKARRIPDFSSIPLCTRCGGREGEGGFLCGFKLWNRSWHRTAYACSCEAGALKHQNAKVPYMDSAVDQPWGLSSRQLNALWHRLTDDASLTAAARKLKKDRLLGRESDADKVVDACWQRDHRMGLC